MHDAIALANLIYAMPATNSKEITALFDAYQKERYPAVLESFNNSALMSKALMPGMLGSFVLFIIEHMPNWLWKFALTKTIR